MSLKTDFYFLSPIEVVKVTAQNLEEVSAWCGGQVAETESKRVPGRLDKYVWVPTPKGTQLSWAFPGMFVTRRLVVTLENEIRETFAVFRRSYFEKNYFATPKDAADLTWERHISELQNGKSRMKVSEINAQVVPPSNVDSLKGANREMNVQIDENGRTFVTAPGGFKQTPIPGVAADVIGQVE